MSVDGGDHRLAHIPRRHRDCSRAERALVLLLERRTTTGQIGARTERGRGARQHDGADRVVLVATPVGIGERLPHAGAEGVANFGPVQRDGCDPFTDVEQNGHAVSCSESVQSACACCASRVHGASSSLTSQSARYAPPRWSSSGATAAHTDVAAPAATGLNVGTALLASNMRPSSATSSVVMYRPRSVAIMPGCTAYACTPLGANRRSSSRVNKMFAVFDCPYDSNLLYSRRS